MTEFDLLNTVQPDEGWFCILGIKKVEGKDDVRQQLVATRKEVDALTAQYVTEKRNVFFAVSKYATETNRKKDNVRAVKSFWLDIDCGEEKAKPNLTTGIPDGYLDQPTAARALKAFCTLIGLPLPIVVDSGRGLHVYWALTEEVSREQWEPVAERLRELCVTHKFYVDNAVFEVARILRIPGTYNFKGEQPALVQPLGEPLEAKQLPLGEFAALLGVKESPLKRVSKLGEYLATANNGNTTTKFTKIMQRSAKGDGCAQLLDCYLNQETLVEPRWFDALSVANKCDDRESAIIKMSERHPEYSFASADAKAKNSEGPHGCEQFERNNPGGCEGCPHQGLITGPIKLGKGVAAASTDDFIKDPLSNGSAGPPILFTPPSYPFPFFRGKANGIYHSDGVEDSDAEPTLVYKNDLYVVKRMEDPNLGDVVVFRLHLPKDGVKEFNIPNVHVSEKAELRKALASYGVLISGSKKFDLLHLYIILSITERQDEERAEKMRTQFGWADGDSKFIVGDKEYSADGEYHSPPAALTEDIAKHMVPKGTLEKWKEVFNLYGRPGLEPHAFAALTAFGSPLFKFVGQSGAILNLIHPSSGTGKSTILYMVNSVMGHPKALSANFADTLNAKLMQLGMMNNLCFTVDEMTNTPAKDFSVLAYSMSQGRGKHRVKSQTNELRANYTHWSNMSLCSSNSSFYEKLASYKTDADGEIMRLLEYKIDYTPSEIIPTDIAKELFDHQLLNNYGHAGPIYAQHLIENLDDIVKGLLAIQRKIDTELKLTQRERFWSAILSCNIAGGLIARRLGLIDWDMNRLYAWATSMLHELRNDTTPPTFNAVQVVGDFVLRHIDNTLVVEDAADKRTHMPLLPTKDPRGSLINRFEPDTKRLFITAKPFKNDCVDLQVNYKDTLAKLKQQGIFLGTSVKRMSKGMKVVSPGVHALIFDASHPDFNFDIEQFTVAVSDTEESDGSRAS
jgi:hypothetical protein